MTDALIKKAKKDFVTIKIKENKSCPKKLWKTLKNLGIPTKVNEASSDIGLKNEDATMFASILILWQTNLIAISAISQRNWLINSL